MVVSAEGGEAIRMVILSGEVKIFRVVLVGE